MTRQRHRWTLLALLGGLAAMASVPSGVATFRSAAPVELPAAMSGDTLRIVFEDGRVVEAIHRAATDEALLVEIEGIATRLELDELTSVEILPSPRKAYREARLTIDDDDVPALMDLVRWLQRQHLYAEAEVELAHVLRIDPRNQEARRLLLIVSEQRKLAEKQARRGPAGRDDPELDAERRPGPDEFPLLDENQINLIKVFEIDLDDPPRLIVRRETIDKLLRDHGEHPLVPDGREGREAFRRLSPERIVDVMFRVQARELYDEIEVIGQPAAMRAFRDHVQIGWLTNRCATTRCHGGYEGGELLLVNRRPASEPATYTNFLILERYESSLGLPMIDYEQPERSLLLQMGLPYDDALYAHPRVRGWSPVFESRESRSFQLALDWIDGMYRPRPANGYPIEYKPPRPADRQSSGEPRPGSGER